eukprot:365525-Chlamydomonas_euryale.AAC.4
MQCGLRVVTAGGLRTPSQCRCDTCGDFQQRSRRRCSHRQRSSCGSSCGCSGGTCRHCRMCAACAPVVAPPHMVVGRQEAVRPRECVVLGVGAQLQAAGSSWRAVPGVYRSSGLHAVVTYRAVPCQPLV